MTKPLFIISKNKCNSKVTRKKEKTLITNELIKSQPTKIVDFIAHQLIDFVRTSKRGNYHLLSEGEEISETEFDSKYLNKTVTITKDTSIFTAGVRGYFNYFTQELWFILWGEEGYEGFNFLAHHNLEFILSFNSLEISSISLVLDEFHKDLQEMVKNHLLDGDKKSFSILQDFNSLKSSKYLMNFDPLNLKYLLLDKEYWIQYPTEEPGNLFATRNLFSLVDLFDFTSLSESDSEEDKLFLKLFKNSLLENLTPDYSSKNPLNTSLGINLAYYFEYHSSKLQHQHKESLKNLFEMFSTLLSQEEILNLITTLSKNSYFTIESFLATYLKSEKLIEKDLKFATKLIYNSMRSIKSGEVSSTFFFNLVDFVEENNVKDLFDKLSLTVTITDRDVQNFLEEYNENSQETKSLLKLLSLIKESQSVVYYKLTNIRQMETLTLETTQDVWSEYRNYVFDERPEKVFMEKIESLRQGLFKKTSELNFHIKVAENCQKEQRTQKGLKLLRLYKQSLLEQGKLFRKIVVNLALNKN